MGNLKVLIACSLVFLFVGCNSEVAEKKKKRSKRITVQVLCDSWFLPHNRINCCCVGNAWGHNNREYTMRGDEPEYDSIIKYIGSGRVTYDTDKRIDARMNIRVYSGDLLVKEICMDNFGHAVYSDSKYLFVNYELPKYIWNEFCR